MHANEHPIPYQLRQMTCRDFRQSPSDESPSRRACRMITSSCHPSVIIMYCLIIVIDTHKDRERGDVEVKKRLIVKVNISCDHIFNIGLPVSYQPETAPAQPRPLRPLEPHSTVKHCSNNRYQVGGYNNAMFGSYQKNVSCEYQKRHYKKDWFRSRVSAASLDHTASYTLHPLIHTR